MSAKEYNLWVAEYMIAPYGEERSDLRAGTIVQSNLVPHCKKEVKFKDCMLNFDPPEPWDWRKTKNMLFARSKAMNKGK